MAVRVTDRYAEDNGGNTAAGRVDLAAISPAALADRKLNFNAVGLGRVYDKILEFLFGCHGRIINANMRPFADAGLRVKGNAGDIVGGSAFQDESNISVSIIGDNPGAAHAQFLLDASHAIDRVRVLERG